MLLMVEKGIKGEISHTTIHKEKLITNEWKIMIKLENRHKLNIGM